MPNLYLENGIERMHVERQGRGDRDEAEVYARDEPCVCDGSQLGLVEVSMLVSLA
jgi:hypothetical protein